MLLSLVLVGVLSVLAWALVPSRSLSLPLSLYLCLSLALSLSLSLSLVLFSLCLSISLSLNLYLSVSHFSSSFPLCLSVSLSLSHLYLYLSVSPNIYLSLSLSLSLTLPPACQPGCTQVHPAIHASVLFPLNWHLCIVCLVACVAHIMLHRSLLRGSVLCRAWLLKGMWGYRALLGSEFYVLSYCKQHNDFVAWPSLRQLPFQSLGLDRG